MKYVTEERILHEGKFYVPSSWVSDKESWARWYNLYGYKTGMPFGLPCFLEVLRVNSFKDVPAIDVESGQITMLPLEACQLFDPNLGWKVRFV